MSFRLANKMRVNVIPLQAPAQQGRNSEVGSASECRSQLEVGTGSALGGCSNQYVSERPEPTERGRYTRAKQCSVQAAIRSA